MPLPAPQTCRGWMTPTLNLALIYGRQSLRIQWQPRQCFIGLLSSRDIQDQQAGEVVCRGLIRGEAVIADYGSHDRFFPKEISFLVRANDSIHNEREYYPPRQDA